MSKRKRFVRRMLTRSSALSGAGSQLPQAASLLIEYQFTDGSGGTVTDAQGNYNGTLGIPPYTPSGNEPTWIASPFNGVQFAGVDADNDGIMYILNSTNADAVVGAINADFSVAMKVRILAADAAGASSWWGDATFSELRWQNTAKRVPYWLGVEDVAGAMKLTGGQASATNNLERFNANTTMNINTTYTVGLTITSGSPHTMRLYLNGASDITAQNLTGTDRQVDEGQNTNWTIAGRTTNTGDADECANVQVGDFAFWNGVVLSEAEFATIHSLWTA